MAGAKRPAQRTKNSDHKRRKLASTKTPGVPAKQDKGKAKASDRQFIPIPVRPNDSDDDLSEQDLDVVNAFGKASAFLTHLDEKGIARSKKETERLHRLHKPVRARPTDDDLPSIDSHDEDEGSWSSGVEEDVLDSAGPSHSGSGLEEDDEDGSSSRGWDFSSDSNEEMPYETLPRQRRPSWEMAQKPTVSRLPIKLPDGRIQATGHQPISEPAQDESASSSSEDDPEADAPAPPPVEDVSTGARFGRPAVVDVIGHQSRKVSIQGAKDQIAAISQDIVADPENSLGLLRRLHTFSLARISSPARPEPVKNDPIIRKLALLSQLAVFKDIAPGYRIRQLTDKEKGEKVSQMVARTREWEQGLVGVYQAYLRLLEGELKAKSELADVALRCMCTLLGDLTHFNFRVNLMSCVVAQLSRKSWDNSSEMCHSALVKVFREDLTGQASLEAVRLLNRMIKERRFRVNPQVLSCLLSLRLKTELGVRASESKADTHEGESRHRSKGKGRGKGKGGGKVHLSKKAKKAQKEKQEIEKEFQEAEAEVNKEERAATQTETLKLLFVLYFSILKAPRPTRMLTAALHGIARYAHLVNIDFFRDLVGVLKHLIAADPEHGEQEDDDEPQDAPVADARVVRHKLLCIVTAFELLSGQGEALNLDLSDFIGHLYAIILTLSLTRDIDGPGLGSIDRQQQPQPQSQSTADMLFRALDIIFSTRTMGSTAPAWRAAAFAKRLLTASLHWPPPLVLRALDFVQRLVAKEPALDALLRTDERAGDGVYRADVDDPQLFNAFAAAFWELHVLQTHWDARVRERARALGAFERS